jgi:leader peptidase (prepilin peptidase)/N-methyltransferase
MLMIILQFFIAGVFGLLVGNFITSFYYRLSNGLPITGQTSYGGVAPHCSSCSHILKFYEYLPLLSWLTTGGKCNYCGVLIDKTYYIMELSCAAIGILGCSLIGLQEPFIFFVLFWAILLLLSFLYSKSYAIPYSVLATGMVIGVIYRTLIDGTCYGWITSLFIASTICLILQKSTPLNTRYLLIISLLLAGSWLAWWVTLLYAIYAMTYYILLQGSKPAVLLLPIFILHIISDII